MKFMNMEDGNFHNLRDGEGDGAGGGGGGTPTFTDSLPEDLRGNEALANFKDVGGLAKSYVEAKAFQGSSIRIPSEEASEEDRNAFNTKLLEQVPSLMHKPNFDDEAQSAEFYATLGKPSEASEYGMPEVEGVEVGEDRAEFLQSVAHKANLTKAQFEVIMQATLGADAEAVAAGEARSAEEAKALKDDWGMALPERRAEIIAVAKHTGAPDRLIEAIEKDAAGLETMNWLHKVSSLVKGEGVNLGGDNGNGDGGDGGDSGKLAPAEARAKISEINGNKQHPYWNQNDPAHSDALLKMVEYNRAAAGG